MAGLIQLKVDGIADSGHEGPLLNGQTGLGQQQIDLQHGIIAVAELRLQRAHLRRESGQDAGDLLLFLRTQLHDAGVGLDHSGRLYKDGSAGGGNVVDDAADLAAILSTYRHDITTVTQRNHSVLQKFIGGGVFDDGIQFGADGILGLADLAAQVGQRGAGGVGHFFRRDDAVGNLALQHRLRRQRIEQVIGGHHVMLTQTVPLAQACKIAQRGGNFQQFPHREDAALLGMSDHAPHLGDRAEARAAVFDQQAVDGVGLLQSVAFVLRGLTGLQILHHFLGLPAGAKLHGTG